MTTTSFLMYGVQNSWYAAKVRSYLLHKAIPYVERRPSLLDYYRRIPQRCVDPVVPVLVTPEGEWWQDSSVILERLEQRYPTGPMLPGTPVLRTFALLLELWADEFWIPACEHTRFHFPENMPAWHEEVGNALLPGAPGWLQRLATRKAHQDMLTVTARVGARNQQNAQLEHWLREQLDALDAHFARHPFLLGTRASLADFALMGPIQGHLVFDVYSRRALIEPRRHLSAWIQRMSRPRSAIGAFFADDRIPESLTPLLRSLVEMLPPCLRASVADVQEWGALPPGERFPRWGREAEYICAGAPFRRDTVPYALWMFQRVMDHVEAMPPADARRARAWLSDCGGSELLTLSFPRLRRVGLHAARELVSATAPA